MDSAAASHAADSSMPNQPIAAVAWELFYAPQFTLSA